MWSAISTMLITIGCGSFSVTESTMADCFGSLTNGSKPASWRTGWSRSMKTGCRKAVPCHPCWQTCTCTTSWTCGLNGASRRAAEDGRSSPGIADDFVAAFQDQEDAERFRREIEERLAAFELHVAPEKTAVLRFDGNLLQGTGRPAIKPATFTFLGFKHFLTKTRRGTINIGRTASIKARERFLRRQADWLTGESSP